LEILLVIKLDFLVLLRRRVAVALGATGWQSATCHGDHGDDAAYVARLSCDVPDNWSLQPDLVEITGGASGMSIRGRPRTQSSASHDLSEE
jgi:hypothetical protein